MRVKPKTVDKYLEARGFFLSDAFCNVTTLITLHPATIDVAKSDVACRTMQRVFVAKCDSVAKCNGFRSNS